MLHHMKLQPAPFEMIRNGQKSIEIRLNDEKRQKVQVGDTIEFSLITDPAQKIQVIVESLHHFANFKDLCYAFNPIEYGSANAEEYSLMYDYYSKEDEAKYGVVGIGVKLLVYIDQYGLLGSNFYWHKYESQGLTKEDVLAVGLKNERVQIHKDIIQPLVSIDAEFQKRGYKLYLKEGYRSKALYEMIYKIRVAKFGKEETDRLLNMKQMPHSNGKSVDVALWDSKEDKEVCLRCRDDGTDALFVDFYKNKDDDQSKKYQELQEWIFNIMENHGFRLGTKREYFHFNYRPDDPRDY